jgi:hypothetical protein
MAAIVYEVDVNFRVQLLVKQRVFGELYRYTLYYNIVSELLCLICSIFREHLNTKQNAQYNCNIEADSVQSPWSFVDNTMDCIVCMDYGLNTHSAIFQFYFGGYFY